MKDENRTFLAGAIAGFFGIFIAVPVDLMKIRSQVKKEAFPQYKRDFNQIVKNEGYPALYKGFWATMWRDVPGWGVYFWAYEYLKIRFGIPFNSRSSTDDFKTFMFRTLAAGTAGSFSWFVSFPFDVAKTRIQTN
jgi:solute carrier family 25 carnitine/acylcarnitine transporter 20/29